MGLAIAAEPADVYRREISGAFSAGYVAMCELKANNLRNLEETERQAILLTKELLTSQRKLRLD